MFEKAPTELGSQRPTPQSKEKIDIDDPLHPDNRWTEADARAIISDYDAYLDEDTSVDIHDVGNHGVGLF